jgi:hypothetical protein
MWYQIEAALTACDLLLDNSNRVAEEMDVDHGQHVGYTIRFEVSVLRNLIFLSSSNNPFDIVFRQDKTSDQTILKFMTDGTWNIAVNLFRHHSSYRLYVTPPPPPCWSRNAAEGGND